MNWGNIADRTIAETQAVGTTFSDWIGALAVVVAMIFVATAVRGILSHFSQKGRWAFLRQIAPSASNLIYIVGLGIFADVAPLSPKFANWLDGGVYVLAVLILLGLLRRAALIGIEWGSVRSNQSATLQQGFIPLMRNVITLFVFLTGGIMILKHFNYDVMSLLTALGVGSLAVGLAAKDTLSNMISGFTLIIDRNLRPGDKVNLGGTIGDVEEIGLRSTRMKLGDGNTLIVPNSELVNTKILNLSLPSTETSCSTSLRVPLNIPFERVEPLCLETIAEISIARKDRGKWVSLSSLGDGYQLISIGFWVSNFDDSGGAISEFNQRILKRLAAEKIPLFVSPGVQSPNSPS